jgi:general secretion pathway protein G
MRRGFTLIELLVVMAVLALLASLVAPRYLSQTDRAREAVLRTNLKETREAIDQYFADKGAYPSSLSELVAQRYLKALPVDPMTGRNDTWTLVAPEARGGATAPGVRDVRSSAQGRTQDGVAYGAL